MFVIHDELGGGWVVNNYYYCSDDSVVNPIEGWMFTIIPSSATQFATRREAEAVMRRHYGTARARLVIQKPADCLS